MQLAHPSEAIVRAPKLGVAFATAQLALLGKCIAIDDSVFRAGEAVNDRAAGNSTQRVDQKSWVL